MNNNIEQQLKIIKRGTVEILVEDVLTDKLRSSEETGIPLNIKAGFDPTAPDLHLGHTVLIHKLKQFQDIGHQVIVLIGNFTGMIGDPSGKSATRKALSRNEVMDNADTYQRQLFKILDREKTKVVFNSMWMDNMTAFEMMGLCSNYTVARMLERDDFSKRFAKQEPIGIHEFIYPLIQGYDSVVLEADIEVGGTDQKFNMLVGRGIQKSCAQKPQVVITMPILEGLDGVNKMSKSLKNYIGIDFTPGDMFGKIMSISDELMMRYYELISNISTGDLELLKGKVETGEEHPKEVKRRLALEIVERFHSRGASMNASEEFDKIFKFKGTPEEIKEKNISWSKNKIWLPHLITLCSETVSSNGKARRLIKQGGVSIDKKKIMDPTLEIDAVGECVLKIGKREFIKVVFK